MTDEYCGYYDPDRRMTFCIAEKGRHPNCKGYENPVEPNGRPCQFFRKDIDRKCDNPSVNFNAWKSALKTEH